MWPIEKVWESGQNFEFIQPTWHIMHRFKGIYTCISWLPTQRSGQFEWTVVNISVCRHKRRLILTTAVELLAWNLSFHKTTGYLRTMHFLREEMQVPSMHEFRILQGTVSTFYKCGGQVQKHFSKISSGFCMPKIIQIGLFLQSY